MKGLGEKFSPDLHAGTGNFSIHIGLGARALGRVLSQVQEDTIQRMIIDKRPEQLKMDFHLWSRAAVGQLIEQEFGIELQTRSVGKYLTRWGFTPQKPIKRAYE